MAFKPIRVEFVKSDQQRYPTSGDYYETDKEMVFKITRLSGLRSIYILIHEIWECYKCLADGIEEKKITDFDLSVPGDNDPGWFKEAPYHKQHIQADALERLCCVFAGDDWIDYEKEIDDKV